MKASKLSSWALVKIFPLDLKCHASFLQINGTDAQALKTDNHMTWDSKAAVSKLSPFRPATVCVGGTVRSGENWFVFDNE